MRQIKSFINDAAIQAAVDDKTLGKPYVALDENTGKIDWNSKDIDYASMYLTIEALETGTFYVRNADVSYSVNGGAWETTTGETALALNQGDTVRFKSSMTVANALFNSNDLSFNIYGNIMSLRFNDDFKNKTNAFRTESLLHNCSGLIDASNLILPATILEYSCYNSMFGYCTNLTSAPALPATTLANSCYYSMFDGCTSLTTAPALPATTLVESCYTSMFQGCTNLISAPELLSDALVDWSCPGMFRSCSSLNYVKCLATDISVNGPTTDWLVDVSPTGTFVKKAGVTWPTGVSGIPEGWTVIEE